MFPLEGKLYIKLDSHWFDLTEYSTHPGGFEILKQYHLKDATDAFNAVKGHSDSYVDSKLKEFEIKNPILRIYLNTIQHT